MDAKDLRAESSLSLSEHKDDNTNYVSNTSPYHFQDKNKSYHELGSNSIPKVDVQTSRPCAVIGPDRIIQPPVSTDPYIKRGHVEPWQFTRPPEYLQKGGEYIQANHNISPRQTFQENMHRVMVPSRTLKLGDDQSTSLEKSVLNTKNIKINVPSEAKYSDVPYSLNTLGSEAKVQRNTELNVNPTVPVMPHSWQGSALPSRPYGNPDLYQLNELACSPQHALPVNPHRTSQGEVTSIYGDPYRGKVRYEPYPSFKDRNPMSRYDYMSNYTNSYPPQYIPHKYHPAGGNNTLPHPSYPGYHQIPLKYMRDPIRENYQRSPNPQPNYNLPYHNQVPYLNYGSIPGNCIPNKSYGAYSNDPSINQISSSKIPYEAKPYVNKNYTSENMYDVSRSHNLKAPGPQNYPHMNIHSIPPQTYYRKDLNLRNYGLQYRNIEQGYNTQLSKIPSHFSPNLLSPIETNVGLENHSYAISPEDCGYASQSSTTSVRSSESVGNFYRVYDQRYANLNRGSPLSSISESENKSNKNKKGIDVRQFLKMWNEGDEESENNGSIVHSMSHNNKQYELINNQEQLYVLGLVNVPREELSKYEHIQKVSKLPDNIKGYTSIDLLNQFEEAIESSNLNTSRMSMSSTKLVENTSVRNLNSRPMSPLDVEAKITQSVIHKEVGCNFEIKPCSPKMMNVEIPSTATSVLEERTIEKVTNKLVTASPNLMATNRSDSNVHSFKQDQLISANRSDTNVHSFKHHDQMISANRDGSAPSCKMTKTQFVSTDEESLKTDYNIQDFESLSGVCLASLPRLDNDIELSFPEVNQQFINANKGELVSSESHMFDISDSNKDDTNIMKIGQTLGVANEFSKLSKYRKNKYNKEIYDHLSHCDVQATRTDSVIIKNPDSSDNYNTNEIPVISKEHEDDSTLLNTQQNLEFSIPTIPQVDEKSDNSNENKEMDNIKAETYEAINLSLHTETDLAKNPECSQSISDVITQNIDSFSCEPDGRQDSNFDNNELEKLSNDNTILNINENLTVDTKDNFCIKNKDYLDQQLLNIDNDTISVKVKNCDGNFIENKKYLEDNIFNVKSREDNFVKIEDDFDKDANIDIINENVLVADSNECAKLIKDDVDKNSINLHNFFAVDTDKVEEPILTKDDDNNLDNADNNKITYSTDSIKHENTNIIKNGDLDENIMLVKNTGAPNNCKLTQNNGSNSNQKTTRDDNNLTNYKNYEVSKSDDPDGVICRGKLYKKTLSQIYKELNNKVDSHNLIPNQNKVSVIEKDFKKYLYEACNNLCLPDPESSLHLELSIEIDSNNEETNSLDLSCEKVMIEPKFFQLLNHTPEALLSPLSADSTNDSSQDYIETKCKELESSKIDCPTINDEIISHDNMLLNLSLDKETLNNEAVVEVNITSPLAYISQDKCDLQEEKTICLNLKNVVEKNQVKTYNEFGNFEHEKYFENAIDNPGDNGSKEATYFITEVQKKYPDIVFDMEKANPTKEFIFKPISKKVYKELYSSTFQQLLSTEEGYINFTHNNLGIKNIVYDEENMINDKEIRTMEKPNISQEIFDVNNTKEINSDMDTKQPQIESELLSNGSLANSKLNNVASCLDNYTNKITNKDNIPKILENNKLESIPRRHSLKRSLSDSEIHKNINNLKSLEDTHIDSTHGQYSVFETKKRKLIDGAAMLEPNDNNSTFQSRRNSVSSFYQAENISFCILIDNSCIITEDDINQNAVCFTNIEDDNFATVVDNHITSEKKDLENTFLVEENFESSDPYSLDYEEEKEMEENWVGVACVETVVSDDIVENDSQIYLENNELKADNTNHAIEKAGINDNFNEESIQSLPPQINSNIELLKESSEKDAQTYDYGNEQYLQKKQRVKIIDKNKIIENHKLLLLSNAISQTYCEEDLGHCSPKSENVVNMGDEIVQSTVFDDSTESEVLSDDYKRSSSSPEVSSTTSEDKKSGILLKITNYNGSRVSQLNENCEKKIRCKFTESNDFSSGNIESTATRPLITKAAQKYIPPLKETIRHLKVKLILPQQSLQKLKELKTSKQKSKTQLNSLPNNTRMISKNKVEFIKKPKPNFEDVLKNIDAVQIQLRKDKSKKIKGTVPKVIIKKSENGCHYTSSPSNKNYDPDLTGRKWQPWVFIEKNTFIDRMAIKSKTKAVFCHRKNTYILLENFRKYRAEGSSQLVAAGIANSKLSKAIEPLRYNIKLK